MQTKFIRGPLSPTDSRAVDTCLVEFDFGIFVDSMLIANGPVFIEKLHVVMNETKAVIHEAFYNFIRDAKNLNKNLGKTKRNNGAVTTVDAAEVHKRIFHIIPKVFCVSKCIFFSYIKLLVYFTLNFPQNFVVKIQNATLSAENENSIDDFSAKLQMLTVCVP